MFSFASEGAGRIEMDVPRGRLEIGDYVGGQLCKAVMCQLPAVAMYRGSPPSQLPRNSILYCYPGTVFGRLLWAGGTEETCRGLFT